MKKIAFYIDNSAISDIDMTDIEKGNPGIGGTEYLIYLIATLLSKSDNGLDITLYMMSDQKLPQPLRYRICGSLRDAIHHSENDGAVYFILKHNADNIKNNVLATNGRMQFIVWCHVFVCFWELDYYAENKDVFRIVYVGREHLQLNIDHPAYAKSTYIYNAVGLDGCREKVYSHPFEGRKHVVTYLGSLMPYKGFHLLAQAWPEVIRRVPDAELYIIGNGKVYDSDAKLGALGLADSSYEELFLKPLQKDNGELLPGIHFLGRMGREKEEILLITKVGVPNPSGITETFCLSAVEMQAYGAKIATIKAPGYIDTVRNGVLYKKYSQLADTIVSQLNSSDSNYEDAMRYFQREFSCSSVLKCWEALLTGIPIRNDYLTNRTYRLKWLKNYIRIVHDKMCLSIRLPLIERLIVYVERRILRKNSFMDSNLSL